jgi:hypothetical protein
LRWRGVKGQQNEGVLLALKEPQALDVSRAEGPRFAEDRRLALGLVELEAEGQVAGEQLEAERDAVGMQPGGHQMIQVLAIDQLVQRLLDAPALAIQSGETAGTKPNTVQFRSVRGCGAYRRWAGAWAGSRARAV